jgi:hypothetical protein
MIYDRRRQLNLFLFRVGTIQTGAIMVGLAGAALIGWSDAVTLAQNTLPPPPINVPSELPPIAPPEALPAVNLAPASVPATYLKGHRVYVNGDSPLLLQQVRSVEPTAFVQTYQGRRVIQVGLFSNEVNARQKVDQLAAQGIQSEVTNELMGSALSSGPQTKGYYVVIPAAQADLPQIRDQALRMGVPQHLLSLRDRPLGTHVAVGPFPQKKDAQEVEQYLHKGGLNTRVYFDR